MVPEHVYLSLPPGDKALQPVTINDVNFFLSQVTLKPGKTSVFLETPITLLEQTAFLS